MSNDYYRGYAAGRLAMQPEWVSIKDHLPPRDGHYYVIAEAQKGFHGHPIGTIALDTEEYWRKGKWNQNDKFWKVLYWAKPLDIELPEELLNRCRAVA